MTDRDLLKQALEALETYGARTTEVYDIIDTLCERLEQPQQEPVAWMVYTLDGKSVCVTDNPADFTEQHKALPLYTAPQRREWVGLTEEEMQACWDDLIATPEFSRASVYRAIEAKLKEKNYE